MFKDSRVAAKMKCGRTKVSVLAAESVLMVKQKASNRNLFVSHLEIAHVFFAEISDASNHGSSEMFLLCVR